MARLNRKKLEAFLVVQEIMSQTVIFLHMLIAQILECEQLGSRMQRDRIVRYVMSHRIHDQVSHMRRLTTFCDTNCVDNLRMDRSAFARLCYLVENVGGLVDSRYVTVSEKVAIFLTILAHHKKNVVVKFDFWRSGYTISVHFHAVLKAILKLHRLLLIKPQPVDDNCNVARWKPFQGCLGALDGSYIDVQVRKADKARYRTRKGSISVNVLGVVDNNMNFIYALPGWEGSVADSRVLRDAVNRPNGLHVPIGQYYLCDAGYMNCEGFLTPYRSVRYHLDEWAEGSRAPQNAKEYYNMMHSRARNVIERTWGCMKWRWAVLRSPTFYDIKTQNRIILACALLHNFIRKEIDFDPAEAAIPDLHQETLINDDVEYIDNVETSDIWTSFRDNLAESMYNDWRMGRINYE